MIGREIFTRFLSFLKPVTILKYYVLQNRTHTRVKNVQLRHHRHETREKLPFFSLPPLPPLQTIPKPTGTDSLAERKTRTHMGASATPESQFDYTIISQIAFFLLSLLSSQLVIAKDTARYEATHVNIIISINETKKCRYRRKFRIRKRVFQLTR